MSRKRCTNLSDGAAWRNIRLHKHDRWSISPNSLRLSAYTKMEELAGERHQRLFPGTPLLSLCSVSAFGKLGE
jgi:hypothetical protein